MDLLTIEGAATSAVTLLTALGMVWGLLTRQSSQNAEKLEALDAEHNGKLGELDRRLAVVESARPTHDDMDKLHSRVSDVRDSVGGLNERVGKLDGSLEAQTRILSQILGALIDDKGRAA